MQNNLVSFPLDRSLARRSVLSLRAPSRALGGKKARKKLCRTLALISWPSFCQLDGRWEGRRGVHVSSIACPVLEIGAGTKRPTLLRKSLSSRGPIIQLPWYTMVYTMVMAYLLKKVLCFASDKLAVSYSVLFLELLNEHMMVFSL